MIPAYHTAAATSRPSPPLLPSPSLAEKDYFDTLQPGLRFNPTDVELIRDYLKPKLAKSLDPFKSRIHCVNIYDHNPDELTAKYRPFLDTCWYFFTPRMRKYPHGYRPKRIACSGFWKATSADCPIFHNGVKMGTKRTLVFHIKNSDEKRLDNSKRTYWIMHEYRDNTEVMSIDKGQNSMLDENVLCKIYNNKREKLRAMDDDMSRPHLDSFVNQVLETAVNTNIRDHQSVALGLGVEHADPFLQDLGPNHFEQYMSSLEPIANEAAGTSRQHEHHSRTSQTKEIEIPRFKKKDSQVKRKRKSVNLLEKSMSKLSLEKKIDDSNDETLMKLMKSMEIEESNKKTSGRAETGWLVVTPEVTQEADDLKEGCDHLKPDDGINKSSDCEALEDGSNDWMIVPKE